MFGAGQQIAFGGSSSHRLSVRALELPPALRQSCSAQNTKRILVPDLRHLSVRGFRHSAVKENKYSGEYSMTNQREAIWKTMNPEAFKVLTERTAEINDFQANQRKGDDKGNTSVSLLEKVMMYRKDYTEKSVLLCETTATRIMESVAKQSMASRSKTQFVDSEGGLCMLASKAEQMPDLFDSVAVLEKDMGMTPLHSHARSKGALSRAVHVHYYQGGLPKMAADNMEYRGSFPTPLNEFLPKESFSEEVPSYTIVLTATLAVIKYLTHRRLYQTRSPIGEFYAARPEFFFIVTPRTFFHMHCGAAPLPSTERLSVEEMRENVFGAKNQNTLMTPKNIAFQLLFDFCLVDLIPRRAFFPWRPPPKQKAKGGMRLARFEEHKENLMVVYARPKSEDEVNIGTPHHLGFFLSAMMKRKSSFLVATLESYCAGSGLPVVWAGYNIFTLISDLKPHQLFEVYQLLIASPDYATSSFVVQADLWADAQKNPRGEGDAKTKQTEKERRKEYKRKVMAAFKSDSLHQKER